MSLFWSYCHFFEAAGALSEIGQNQNKTTISKFNLDNLWNTLYVDSVIKKITVEGSCIIDITGLGDDQGIKVLEALVQSFILLFLVLNIILGCVLLFFRCQYIDQNIIIISNMTK